VHLPGGYLQIEAVEGLCPADLWRPEIAMAFSMLRKLHSFHEVVKLRKCMGRVILGEGYERMG